MISQAAGSRRRYRRTDSRVEYGIVYSLFIALLFFSYFLSLLCDDHEIERETFLHPRPSKFCFEIPMGNVLISGS